MHRSGDKFKTLFEVSDVRTRGKVDGVVWSCMSFKQSVAIASELWLKSSVDV